MSAEGPPSGVRPSMINLWLFFLGKRACTVFKTIQAHPSAAKSAPEVPKQSIIGPLLGPNEKVFYFPA